MLPILKKRQDTTSPGLSIKYRTKDGLGEKEPESHTVESCTKELIDAIHAKDTSAAAKAFIDIFKLLEMKPHDEVEHEPHSYDASKT